MAVNLATRPPVVEAAPSGATRVFDPVFWIAIAGATLLGFGVRGPVTAAALGIAVVITPGALLVGMLRPADRLERLVVAIALSAVTWMLIAHVMLTVRLWYPDVVAAVALGAFALARLARPASAVSAHAPFRWRSVVHPQLAVTAATLALWAWSMRSLDVSDIGLLGLVGELPVTWFVALAIGTVGAAVAATAPRTSVLRVVVAVVPLLVMIYGTVAASIGTIRYPWAYKHVGVIRLLDETGRLHPDVDIYNNFSGFFGLFALVRGATGVDPTAYAAWAQLVGEGVVLLGVGYLAHRVTGSVRVAYLTVVIYLLSNWVGQNYFAAQTLGSFLALVTLGMIWSWFKRERATTGADATPPPPARLVALRRIGVAAAFFGLLMTHPLTPFVVIGAVVAAVAVGWVRDRRLLVALTIVFVAWVTRTFTYFAAQDFDLGFGGSPADNANGNVDISYAPSQALLISFVTRSFSLLVWFLAGLGIAAASWAKRNVALLIVLAMVPFGIPLVQSYGGEAIYRVYLYSLPLIAALIAWGVASITPVARRGRLPQPTVLASVLCLCLAAGFVVVHYGRERINQVDHSEVAMDAYVDRAITGPAILAQFSAGYPAQSSPRYAEFQVTDTFTPYVTEMLGPRTTLPPPFALEDVADDLLALTDGTPYIVVSPGMIDEIAVLGTFPVDSTAEATAFLLSNPRYRVVARIDDTYLVEVT